MNGASAEAPPPDALPLADAMRELLPAELWEAHARAKKAHMALPGGEVWISEYLYGREEAHAANQDARQKRAARLELERTWRAILAELTTRLASGTLIAMAQDDAPFGPWRAIPAPAWGQLRITHVKRGEAKVGDRTIRDIRILLPVADDHIPTGMPGRRTLGREIILSEFHRRRGSGETAPTLAAESRTLAEWYRTTYPLNQCPTSKTISGNLLPAWRAAGLTIEKCGK
jgi:hypothetical protein